MRLATCFLCACLAFAALGGSSVRSAPTPKETAAQDAQSFAPKPTPEHKMLAKDVGTWDATIKTYMAGPDSPPTESKGVETSTMMSGGLWLVSSFKGEFAGQPFEGTGVTGFDPKKKKYVGTWADSMTPELSLMEGAYDEKTKTTTMTGDGTGEDGKPVSMQYVTEHVDDNTRIFTINVKGDQTGGKWTKMMQISYKRRAK
jgi:Protein of unknown function (DUF1579)